ncbi:hypothetical protein [Streptomyces sp. NPDC001678]|uniref:hypothetical protein n=1 Tax=Streptomyces sp. NPDC001678 TaxID=3364599 RepID=UPI003680895E
MVRRPKTKKKRPAPGMPKEIILLAGQEAWVYTFTADDAGDGCGKVAMPSGAAIEDVQAAVCTSLASLTGTLHGVDIDVAWSCLTPGSWVGRVWHVAVVEPAQTGGVSRES